MSNISIVLKPFFANFESSSWSSWRRQWHPTPVLLPEKSHGRRSLVGCSPWGNYESDMTKWLHFYFSLSCIGEGNGNPLQCSCLENPRDGGAWWAAVYGVAQSRTWLKWLSSSSSRRLYWQDVKTGLWICYSLTASSRTTTCWLGAPLPIKYLTLYCLLTFSLSLTSYPPQLIFFFFFFLQKPEWPSKHVKCNVLLCLNSIKGFLLPLE